MTAAGPSPADVRWTCDPVERAEDRDPLHFDSEYVCDLRETARALRDALHRSLALLAELEYQNRRLTLRNRELSAVLADRHSVRDSDRLRNRDRHRPRAGTGPAEKSIATRREAEEQERHSAATGQTQRQRQSQGRVAPWI
jgi:hypothetical protein